MPVTPRDWVELAGIVLAATASSIGAFLAVLRFRQERQHVKARLWVRSMRVLKSEVVGQLGGELFNRGRRAQVLVVVLNLEGDGESLPVNPLPAAGRVELPHWIEPGEAFSFRTDLPEFSARV